MKMKRKDNNINKETKGNKNKRKMNQIVENNI